MNKTKIAMLGIMALIAVSAVIPTASAVATLHFVPQDISAEGYGDTINVEIRINLSADETQFSYGQFGFSYDSSCGDMGPYCTDINRTLNTDLMTGIDPSWGSWNWWTMEEGNCCNETMDWIVFSFWLPKNGPADLLVGNFTIHCNSTEYCTNELNFGCIPDCKQVPPCVGMWDVNDEPVEPILINGTFTCGGEGPTPGTFEKELVTDWNLISLPLTSETDMTVANVIDTSLSGSYDELYKYDATKHSFVSLSSSDTMENGVGYFIHMTSVDTWTYSGDASNSMNVGLSEGLNMVGGLNCSKDITDALSSVEGKYRYVARWDATSHKFEVYVPDVPTAFNDFSTMEPGMGYFVSMKTGGTLEEEC
jgi:hypothetical protein